MGTEIEKFGDSTVRIVHQPGNGTRYEAVGVKMPAGFPEQELAWLVAFPLIGVSHFFRPGNFLSVAYVAVKMSHQRNGVKVCEVDLHEMTKCISRITGGKNNAATNDRGYIPALRMAPEP